MKTRKAKKKVGSLTKRPASRWALIHVTMSAPEELEKGMDVASFFEDAHGGKPSMYFARYTEDNTIRITVLTRKTDRELKNLFKRNSLGIFKVKAETKGGGSWEHCHMYQVAKHVFGKKPFAVQDVVHWLFNMTNYNYLQECTSHIEQASHFLTNLIRRPNEDQKEIAPAHPKKG